MEQSVKYIKKRAGSGSKTRGRRDVGDKAFPGLSQGNISLLLRELLHRDLTRSHKEDLGL